MHAASFYVRKIKICLSLLVMVRAFVHCMYHVDLVGKQGLPNIMIFSLRFASRYHQVLVPGTRYVVIPGTYVLIWSNGLVVSSNVEVEVWPRSEKPSFFSSLLLWPVVR